MYIAPLRHAVLHLAASGASFTLDAVTVLGRAAPAQARRFISILATRGVVLVTRDGRIRPARGFEDWRKLQPKTKPGGDRIIPYRAVSKV